MSMPKSEDGSANVSPGSSKSPRDDDREDPLGSAQLPSEIPTGFDRRKFMMRSAMISAAAVMTGRAIGDRKQGARADRPRRRLPQQPPPSRSPPT